MDVTSWKDWSDPLGYAAAGLVFLTFTMRTMPTLRAVAVVSNVTFIAYAATAELAPILLLHAALLPLNLHRLGQLLRREPSPPDADDGDGARRLARLGPTRRLSPGETLFRKGDPADRMFVVTEGALIAPEFGIVMHEGDIAGEVSLFVENGVRAASVRAIGPVEVAVIDAERLRELHFEDPQAVRELSRRIARRLLRDLRAVERFAVRRA